MIFFLKGLALGFSIAAPVGPIGLLCIRRSLTQSSFHGLLTGLGAATADAFYGMVAGLGLTVISGFLVGQQLYLRLIGGVFLLYLGYRTCTARITPLAQSSPQEPLLRTYLSALALTVTNPTTILSFAAAFAGLGLTAGNPPEAALMVVGVFLGSAAWWVILSTTAGIFRAKMSERKIKAVNYASGALIAAFGVLAIATLSMSH